MIPYRQRCYELYASSQWSHVHSCTKGEYALLAKAYAKRYAHILPQGRDARILDVACGAGHFLYLLQHLGYTNALGIDISREQLALAGSMGLDNTREEDAFSYLPGIEGEIDLLVANDFIEHLTKSEICEFLDAAHRSLRRGGVILVTTMNAASLLGAGTVFVDFTHESGFTAVSLRQIMMVCGFTNVEVRGISPVIYDLRSFVRAVLWWGVRGLLRAYIVIADGTGRGLWKQTVVLEPSLYAIGTKA